MEARIYRLGKPVAQVMTSSPVGVPDHYIGLASAVIANKFADDPELQVKPFYAPIQAAYVAQLY